MTRVAVAAVDEEPCLAAVDSTGQTDGRSMMKGEEVRAEKVHARRNDFGECFLRNAHAMMPSSGRTSYSPVSCSCDASGKGFVRAGGSDDCAPMERSDGWRRGYGGTSERTAKRCRPRRAQPARSSPLTPLEMPLDPVLPLWLLRATTAYLPCRASLRIPA